MILKLFIYRIVVGNVNGEVKKLYSLIDQIQSKKGKFDLLICVGKFFAPNQQDLEEFYQEIMNPKTNLKIPIPTYFIDSTQYVSPLMNATKSQNGYEIARNLKFMGRAGVQLINGLRIAFISGIDIDSITTVDKENDQEFLGSYFKHSDLVKVQEDYENILKNEKSGRRGIDIFISSQWPLDIADHAYFNSLSLQEQKQLFYNSSSSVVALLNLLSPRYVYSSNLDVHYKRLPYLNQDSFLTRFISLGSIPGKHKPQDSKQVYIQAIEIEGIQRIQAQDLYGTHQVMELNKDYTVNPYISGEIFEKVKSPLQTEICSFDLESMLKIAYDRKLQIGEELLSREEAEERERAQKRYEQSHHEKLNQIKEQIGEYQQEERTIYVGGFDRHLAIEDLQNFLTKYGKIKNLQRQFDQKGHSKGYVFVEYETKESAEAAVNESGRANILGRKLIMNHKMSKVKVVEDKDCWFCFDNPNIEKHMIFDIRDQFYAALPKGPVTDEHILIIPKKHIGHSLELDNAQEEEYLQMKQDLLELVSKKNGLDYILFERNVPFKFQKALHMNLQIIALPSDSSLEMRVRKLLKVFEQQQNVKFIEIEDKEMDLRGALKNDPTQHFFYLEIPGMKTARGRQKIRFYCVIEEGKTRFDLQFGRVLACHLLNAREKLNWKNCVLDKDAEEQLANKFKKELQDLIKNRKQQ
eukprot:403356100